MTGEDHGDAVHHDTDYPTHGDPTVRGPKRKLVFDTDQTVDWRCPCCGEDGYVDLGRHAASYAICTGDCPVKLFRVFRGGPDGR